MSDSAVILLSGGIDSATALYWAKQRGYELYTLTLDYAQGSKTELRFAEALSRRADAKEHFCLNLPFYRLIQERWPKPGETESRVSAAYVPARNIVFHGIGAALAETLGAEWIIFGSNRDDALVLPDATQRFVEQVNRLLQLGTKAGTEGRAPQILNPLSDISKLEVLRIALGMGVPLADTWSCYEDVEVPCGKCRGCLTRAETFKLAGLSDPALVAL